MKSKKEILFIHSAGPQGVYRGSHFLFTYLRDCLIRTHEVLHPDMPDPEFPHYNSWKAKLKKEFDILSNNTILIGHSLGGSALLKYLSESAPEKSIGGLFLIAPPYWGAENWNEDEYILDVNFSSHLPEIPGIFLYHSKDDDVVPVEHLGFYADKLPSAMVRRCHGGGHLFSKGLPELINDIKSLV